MRLDKIKSKALMFQGTGSDVGKSLMVAGLCRAFANRGLKVAPFKPQNMSNNAAVTADGGEIGRAQALQARACGLDLSVHMNPVLLKPQTDIGSQVVVQGQVVGNASAKDYRTLKPRLLPRVLESFTKLAESADLVLVEGAGSPAEVNLRAGDIANMGFAEAASVPVVLVGDIDRGGVIASLVGTHAVILPDERDLIKGFIINKFRGDPRLFDEGLGIIAERTGWPSFGVVPYFAKARLLPAEDGYALENRGADNSGGALRIVVPRTSRIANFDDLDPLRLEPGTDVVFVDPGTPLPGDADLVVLAGSKATLADLQEFRDQGWDIDLAAHLRRGGRVFGICGGYQMLGKQVSDPDGIEGPAQSRQGLGWLDVETTLKGPKTLEEVMVHDADGHPVKGYEMHMGVTEGPDRAKGVFTLDGKPEGAVSPDGKVSGTYLHGLFANDGFRRQFLANLGARSETSLDYGQHIDLILDHLADHLESHLDIDRLLTLSGLEPS